jgi:hypothetical protein
MDIDYRKGKTFQLPSISLLLAVEFKAARAVTAWTKIGETKERRAGTLLMTRFDRNCRVGI